MEVRVMTIEKHEDCPFSGTGTVIVLEASESFARLFHPPTFREWTMPVRDHINQQGVVDREGFVNSTDGILWPVNQSQYKFDPARLVASIRHEVQRRYLYQIQFSRSVVQEILAELQQLSAEEVKKDLDQLEATTVPVERPRTRSKGSQLSLQEDSTMAKKKEKKSASGHRTVSYQSTTKLDPEKFRGQRQLVAKALGAYSTPKSLTDIVEKVKANGGYKVNADGGLTDSVHFHLRELVKGGMAKEVKEEKEKTTKPELVGATA